MTREECLAVIKLLSALESWSFAEGKRCPDWLYEDLEKAQEILTREILK